MPGFLKGYVCFILALSILQAHPYQPLRGASVLITSPSDLWTMNADVKIDYFESTYF